ncbi:lambda-exonuclease family protein [Hahella ganghwensis]|uniref:lambda-exonuclease family protein n=1 Tax=Hahella ganghwensis TaxID=286420 RepID=UPI000367D0C5|nr:YqaJ viral recombinase family protein [Hahella ganghwensis]
MLTINVAQGSEEWKKIRTLHHTASEASVMMGVSPYATRNELISMKATGTEKEIDEFLQRLFDKGHAAEALARPIAERIIGEELYPIVATDDDAYLLASFDGLTMLEDIIWECKLWNEEKAAVVQTGRVPECDYWQVQQQLYVSKAEYCLYMVTDGTEEKCVYVKQLPVPEDQEKLIKHWQQYEKDLADYSGAILTPEPVGREPTALPALRVEITDVSTVSNLKDFRAAAKLTLQSISTDLQTDEDFANAESSAKWCKDVEKRLSLTRDHVLSQTKSIEEIFNTIDEIAKDTKAKRLDLEKKVAARKQQIRDEILTDAKAALKLYITSFEKEFAPHGVSIQYSGADFAGVMKGKRRIDSLRSAVNDETAKAKVEVDEIAEIMRGNIQQLNEHATGYRFLFDDLQAIVAKPAEDFAAIVQSRILEHKAKPKPEGVSAPRTLNSLVNSESAKARPIKPSRPTDNEIIGVLANHFDVAEETVILWLHDMNLNDYPAVSNF